MSVTWSTLEPRTGEVEEVERYSSLDGWIEDLSRTEWGDPGTHTLEFVTDDQTGEILAIALFSPEGELFVACSDGRRLSIDGPESLKE